MFYTIKEISDLTNVTAHTLRYYEKVGILRDVRRKANGRREYSEDNLAWIKVVKRLKETRMPLGEINEYVASYFNHEDKAIRFAMLLNHKERMQRELENIVDTIAYIDKKVGDFKMDDCDEKK